MLEDINITRIYSNPIETPDVCLSIRYCTTLRPFGRTARPSGLTLRGYVLSLGSMSNSPSLTTHLAPTSTLFTHEFALTDKVALITGGGRGLGLEAAMAVLEAGARAAYCLDVASEPDSDWAAVCEYLKRMGKGRLEYICGDVTKQVCRS